MKAKRLLFLTAIGTGIYTILIILLTNITLDIRDEAFLSSPYIVELIGEGFNVVFVFVIICVIALGYRKNKPFYALFFGAVTFYTSQLYDFLDEIFAMNGPTALAEVLFFPVGLVLFAIGLYKHQKYVNAILSSNNKMKESYKELSIKDNLTGLYNVRHFYHTVPNQIQSCISKNKVLSILMIDIDDFKQVNDTYGHLLGDEIISSLGDLLIGQMNGDVSCYRYGGEEFVLVVEGASIKDVRNLAEGLRTSFSKLVFKSEYGTFSKSISVGLAKLSQSDNVEMVLKKADVALYEAKTTGKNKVCLSKDIA